MRLQYYLQYISVLILEYDTASYLIIPYMQHVSTQ